MGETGIIPKYNEQGGLSYPSSYHVGGRTSQEGNDAVEHIYVINEKLVANEYLYDVVVKAEWLRAAYLSDIDDAEESDIHNACCEINGKLHELLRLVLGKDTNNVVICRSYQGCVWVLELDYLDDGNIYFAPNWPDINELEDEGIKTLVGESIEVYTFESFIEAMRENGEEPMYYSLDELVGMYLDHEPAKASETAPTVKELQQESIEHEDKVLEAEGE